MKKINLTVSYEEEKVKALRWYLEQKGTKLEEELVKAVDTLFNSQICSGYFCEVYRDAEYKHCCDYFSLAFGHDIPEDSAEAVRLGICQYLGLDLNEDLQKLTLMRKPLNPSVDFV